MYESRKSSLLPLENMWKIALGTKYPFINHLSSKMADKHKYVKGQVNYNLSTNTLADAIGTRRCYIKNPTLSEQIKTLVNHFSVGLTPCLGT